MNPISGYREIQFGTFCRSEFNSIASKARWKIIQCRKTVKNQTKNVVGNRIYFLKVIIFFMLLFYFFWLTSCKQVWVISFLTLGPRQQPRRQWQGGLQKNNGFNEQTTLHVHHIFWYISLPSLHEGFAHAKFLWRRQHTVTSLSFSLWIFVWSFRLFNSRKKIALDSQIDRIGIIASVAVVVAEGLYSL